VGKIKQLITPVQVPSHVDGTSHRHNESHSQLTTTGTCPLPTPDLV
jgi:hypothetical protein